MNTNQKGFTLVELIVVIVILGILAATALPKFIDLSTEAGNAAALGVSGAFASSTSINYAAKVAGKTGTVAVTAANVCTNAIAGSLVTGITFTAAPATGTEYAVTGTGDCSGGGTPATVAGNAVTCTVTGFKGVGQSATLICSG